MVFNPIQTERLILTPITEDYAKDIFHSFNSDITRYMYPKPAEKIEETKEFIRFSLEEMANTKSIQLVILSAEDREFKGCLGLHRIDTKTPELGLWLKKEAQGKGFGSEAVSELYKWAKGYVDHRYFIYPVDKRNKASRKIAEKLGGVIYKDYKAQSMSGNSLEVVEYRIS